MSTPAMVGRHLRSACYRPADSIIFHEYGRLEEHAETLVLLHGLANNAKAWRPMLTRLDGERVLVADLPWRGDMIAGGAPYDDYEDALRQSILEAGGPAIVVAHSFSSLLLLSMLHRHFEAGRDPLSELLIRALVLVAPFYRNDPRMFVWGDLERYLNDFWTIMREGIVISSPRRIDEDVLAGMAIYVRDQVGTYGWLRFIDAYLSTPWLNLERFDLPVLVVSGELDETAPPCEADLLAEHLPNARRAVIANAGHFPMSDSPQSLTDSIHHFLQEIRTTSRRTAR